MGNAEEEKAWRGMIKELLNVESGLTKWEIYFLEQTEKFWGGTLSQKQGKRIELIYERVMK